MQRGSSCFSFNYAGILTYRHSIENWSEMYVRLYRKNDGEAWCVRKAYSDEGPQNEGRKITYRDGARDFNAVVISKAEFETFKFFEKVGKK